MEDRAIPTQFSDPFDLAAWDVTRGSIFNGSLLATAAQHASLMAIRDYATFRMTLEEAPFYNGVHLEEVLQPAPIMIRTIGEVMSVRALGYVYG